MQMPKILRKQMKMFGSLAGTNEMAQFGSLAAAAPVYVNNGDPDTIQGLSAWVGGWYDAVIGGNSPAIQDMNALQYVFAYMLSYVMQTGVPEWNAATTYYVGSLVNDGTGNLYISVTNDNTGNALSSTANWLPQATLAPEAISTGSRAIVVADNKRTFIVDASSTASAVTFTLPAAAALFDGFSFTVKRSLLTVGASPGANTIIQRNASELIEAAAANFICADSFGVWTFVLSGGNWYIV